MIIQNSARHFLLLYCKYMLLLSSVNTIWIRTDCQISSILPEHRKVSYDYEKKIKKQKNPSET